jgi:tRNA (mo5U34)-methyltransferase
MKLTELFPSAQHKTISDILCEKSKLLLSSKKGILHFRKPYESVSHIRARTLDLAGDTVCIGSPGELSDPDRKKVYDCMRSFMPWRKGPFQVFGIDIDAEWRSERKWKRVQRVLPDLTDKIIADIGCNNGYYMFRMAHHKPKLVFGFEPYLQHHFTFKTLNSFAGLDNLFSELLGVEHISLFKQCFDVVFLMGILYHRISPVEVLRDIYGALRPGGTLIVESQAIAGEEPYALFPEKKYAKVPGTYFVPTGMCVMNWLKRAGFRKIEIFDSHPMSNQEQRRTDWMVFESFDDFIDAENPSLTVEGYPAPMRVYVKAQT